MWFRLWAFCFGMCHWASPYLWPSSVILGCDSNAVTLSVLPRGWHASHLVNPAEYQSKTVSKRKCRRQFTAFVECQMIGRWLWLGVTNANSGSVRSACKFWKVNQWKMNNWFVTNTELRSNLYPNNLYCCLYDTIGTALWQCYLFVTVHCLANAYLCINYLQLHCRYIHYYYHYIHYLYFHSHWKYHWKLLRMLVCFCQYTVQLPTVGG